MKLLFITFIVSFSLNFSISYAQMKLDWAKIYNGSYGGFDRALGIAVDDSGNVYVTGASQISSPNLECVTIKYNKQGDTLWVRHYFRTGNFIGREIKLDDSGNVFVAAGVILKYSSKGDLIWDSYDSAAYKKIEIDSEGNIYAGGTSLGQLTTGKYNRNGQRIWRNKYSFTGSAGTDFLGGFVKDISGNLIITGASRSTSTAYDYATIKYSNEGVLIWSRRYNGPSFTSFDLSYGIATDYKGNSYVTGSSMDNSDIDNCLTIKYDSAGNTIWINRIPLSADIANAGYNLATDSSQNVFIAARNNGKTAIIKLDSVANILWYTIFSEGNSITNNYPVLILDSAYNIYTTAIGTTTGQADYVGLKYDSSGNQKYIVRYSSGNITYDYVYNLALDNEGSIVLTGEFSGSGGNYGTVKFSPIKTGILENNFQLKDYYLSQNYPNPFNPRTLISYQLPISGYVSLKVYNVLGNEITTLIEEKKKAGTYEIYFNGSNLSSGIYFYRIEAGAYVQTKKMTLIK